MSQTPSQDFPPAPSIRPGRYRHYKGMEYRFVDTVRHSETLEAMVLYQPLYGEQRLWVRPAHMWNETVQVNGQSLTRFQWISEQ